MLLCHRAGTPNHLHSQSARRVGAPETAGPAAAVQTTTRKPLGGDEHQIQFDVAVHCGSPALRCFFNP